MAWQALLSVAALSLFYSVVHVQFQAHLFWRQFFFSFLFLFTRGLFEGMELYGTGYVVEKEIHQEGPGMVE